MQTLDRPKVSNIPPRFIENRSRPTKKSPVLFIVTALLCAGLIIKLHAPGVLLATGVFGIASGFGLCGAVKNGLPFRNRQLRTVLSGAWLVITLVLGISFIISGIEHITGGSLARELAKIEARRTIEAIGLIAIWFAAISIVRRARVPFVLFWSAAAFEVARIMALGLRPTPICYAIWAVTVVIGGVAVRGPKG